ncbi:thiamine diphosphokinase [Candidatus Bipolaricaulota bacterium]|nr:thiamine diphosphokinase [Candidatus Bipolaricaulota bacterium]
MCDESQGEDKAGPRRHDHVRVGREPGSPAGCARSDDVARPAAKHVVVLANGLWENPARIRAIACAADEVIAADGAWAAAKRLGIDVDLVVGDLDSLGPEAARDLTASGVPVKAFSVDKDRTDTEIAVDLALEREARRISICGAGGGRIDHALANVFLLGKRAALGQGGVRLELITATETVVWVEGELALEGAFPGDRVSLIPVDRAVRVSTLGLRFPLSNEWLRRTNARGVSNEVSALPVVVRVSEGAALVIHEPAPVHSERNEHAR